MREAYTFSRLIEQLWKTFRFKGARSPRMTGILFAPPQSRLAKEEIIPSLDYFHKRSGDDIDFFCAGYGGFLSASQFPDMQPVGNGHGKVGEIPWSYSDSAFIDLLNVFESQTKWRYSGEVDLLLADTYFDSASDTAHIDFSQVVVFLLDAMIRDHAVHSVRQLFELIFRIAREQEPTASEFSDRIGVHVLGRSLLDAVVEAIPKAAALTWVRGKHYRVIDLRRLA